MVGTINVEVKGLTRTNKFFTSLPRNVSNAVRKQQLEFMKAVQKSAKLRAPRWSGELARSIHLKKKDRNVVILTVDSPYGQFQEFGYKPHRVHRSLATRAGRKIGDWMINKGITGNFMTVSKFTPFIQPALEMNLSKLSQKLNLAVNRAINKS
jgi:hypothetical protein